MQVRAVVLVVVRPVMPEAPQPGRDQVLPDSAKEERRGGMTDPFLLGGAKEKRKAGAAATSRLVSTRVEFQ